jgi:hypothetical protein
MPPIKLSDDEPSAVTAARPLDPNPRDPFLRAVAHPPDFGVSGRLSKYG